MKILRQFASLSKFAGKNHIDFFTDRLSHTHTSCLILLFMSLTTFRHLKPTIDCWIPRELKRYEAYITKLCWLNGTYNVPIDSYGNVIDDESNKEALITYYQWIVIILLLQAFMFYLPYIIWSSLASKSTFDLSNIMIAIQKYDIYEKDDQQERILNYLASYFKRQSYKFQKIYLQLAYLVIKCVYLANCLAQLILINYFLTNSTYKFNAFSLLAQMLNGTNNQENSVFPTIVQCDLSIKHDLSRNEDESMNSPHFYSIRCILSLNIFVEKIYVFLWLWTLVIALFTSVDLIKCCLNFAFMNSNYKLIKERIKAMGITFEKQELKIFVNKYLARDGIFVLRLIETNAGLLASNDLIAKLWKDFCKGHY